MGTVYIFAVISFIIAVFLGWLLNSFICFLLKYFRPGYQNVKPTLKARVSYAFFTGAIIFIFWVVVVFLNVEMH